MTTEDQTRAVLNHHVESFLKLDFAEILADYTDDSIIMTPTGTVRGLAQLQEAMGQMAGLFSPENLSRFKILTQDVQGEVAFQAWTMGDAVPFGADTFIVRNGKIAVQTIGIYVPE